MGTERKALPFDTIVSVTDDEDDPCFCRIGFKSAFQADYQLWFASGRDRRLFMQVWGVGCRV